MHSSYFKNSGNYYVEMSLEPYLKVRKSYWVNCINQSTEAGVDVAFVRVCKRVSLHREQGRCLERREITVSTMGTTDASS